MTRTIASWAAVAIAAVAASGCGGGVAPGADESESGCVARLVFRSVTYWSSGELREPLVRGDSLGTGLVPGCDDTGGIESSPDRQVTVTAIDGVIPKLAVSIEGQPYAYLAAGYVVESRRHPLHDAIYGSAPPNEEAGFDCDSPRQLRAQARTAPAFGWVFAVAASDEAARSLLERHDDGVVFLDADTVIDGFDRDGVPYIEVGEELSLLVRACSGADGAQKLVVERMGP